MSLVNESFTCFQCGRTLPAKAEEPTGWLDSPAGPMCYDCQARNTVQFMLDGGWAYLYLARKPDATFEVVNFYRTLSFACEKIRYGRAPFGNIRRHFTFIGPDGKRWWGVQIGEHQFNVRVRRYGNHRSRPHKKRLPDCPEKPLGNESWLVPYPYEPSGGH
jgi:hypothetical protein